MTVGQRDFGLIGQLSPGDHVCHFYETPTDLSEILVPYFKWGLEHNEACLWVTAKPYGKDRGLSELRTAVPEFDRFSASGQIQIFDFEEWYVKSGDLSLSELVQSWMSRKDDALDAGYAALRITGNLSFLDETTWDEFQKYERMVDAAFRGQPIISLCSYCQDQCTAQGLFDVMRAHDFALKKTFGLWHPVDSFREPDSTHPHVRSFTDIRSVVSDILAAHTNEARIDGPEIWISRAQTIKLQMILQLLARDAQRNGAFTSKGRSLLVKWRTVLNGSRRLCMTWKEIGAPGFVDESIDPSVILIATLAQHFSRAFTPSGRELSFEIELDGLHSSH